MMPDGFFVGGGSSTILRMTRMVSAVGGPDLAEHPDAGPSARDLNARPLSATRFAISFRVSRQGAMDLGIFDLAGRRVATLASGEADTGAVIDRVWDSTGASGRPVGAGVYFVRGCSGGVARAVKVVVR